MGDGGTPWRQGGQGGQGGQGEKPNDGRCASAGKPVQRTAKPMPNYQLPFGF
ncbi:MAG: hypothetical protein KME31_20130 [Tolypothrix carrinoi HA7290-LM1]|nr:hypothetical protein [Tolypothrix carrinoi HA7290-LM1]